ncbi:PREDICTED: DNA repair and recombination protein RAD54B-like isoform X3 [Vollenhovia emeryi]|uniref:DNA repair and recombination protein RAD54B-like isoform X3 n=1 Tax=Vollenhovia emeryi TaxID=411798 RepID=UPI0005F57467|nr:PREDICTED: DNA repair and recombination protein RAD54B-like isoform X3 [Vollenhovia emeryi]
MYRNRPVKGFTSPLIVEPRPSTEESEENKVSIRHEKAQSTIHWTEKPPRNNLQILNLFAVTQENEVGNAESNPSRKRDVISPVREKETPVVDSPRATAKIVFNVMYGKISSRKHKTWDGDGLLEVIGKSAILKDLDGNVMGRATVNPSNVAEGSRLIIKDKQIEILDQTSQDLPVPEKNSDVAAEKPLRKKPKTSAIRGAFVSPERKESATVDEKKESTDSPEAKIKSIFNVMYGKVSSKKHKTWDSDGLLEVTGKTAILKDLDGNVLGRGTIHPSNAIEGSRLVVGNKQVEIVDQVSQELFVPEKSLEETVEELLRNKAKVPSTRAFVPLFSSTKGLALNSEPLVMPYLNSIEWTDLKEQEVSVDSCLVAKFREHQRHGIVFLYECLMGLRVPDYFGAILADEMGLGKTLQCIALIWTMLKKGPYGNPIVKRVLIAAPSSLCNNWEKEFIKWLGSHRMSPYVVSGKNRLKDFKAHPRNSVMIISYEMFVKCHTEISEIAFDLIVCDEGHRLKNSNVKAAKLLHGMDCRKRIILTGTPIQNDLKEFYTLIDFINPGILGTPTEYKHYYEEPVVASQCPYADDDVIALGKERSTELYERTKAFILRRTQTTINKYLPHKYEIVLFCSLSKEQRDLYSLVTDAWFDKICLEDKSNIHLSIITALKKICNHPNLFVNEKGSVLHDTLSKASFMSQMKRDENFTEYCGKVTILQALMRNLKKTDEKLVLVSYYTRTLDLLGTICNMERLKFLRLDGTTSSSKRSKITEQFNTRTDDSKILLLSAKAGGVGLNLPGASRLVLFDSDWNPASDVQAMARIWRDGQKKDVYIYRFLTTGTIEEKIYQRQISKAGLSESVVDLNHLGSLKLSTAELKMEHLPSEELKEKNNETRDYQFTLNDKSSQQNLTINQLRDWHHYKQPIPSDVMQDIMLTEVSSNITFIFKNSTIHRT